MTRLCELAFEKKERGFSVSRSSDGIGQGWIRTNELCCVLTEPALCEPKPTRGFEPRFQRVN